MFIKQEKTGAAIFNGLILMVVVFVTVVLALAVVKIVKDPKNPEGYRNKLALK